MDDPFCEDLQYEVPAHASKELLGESARSAAAEFQNFPEPGCDPDRPAFISADFLTSEDMVYLQQVG